MYIGSNSVYLLAKGIHPLCVLHTALLVASNDLLHYFMCCTARFQTYVHNELFDFFNMFSHMNLARQIVF